MNSGHYIESTAREGRNLITALRTVQDNIIRKLGWVLLIQTAIATHALGATVDPLKPPAESVLEEARTIVRQMADNPKGPYSRIRWYCKDGTVLPPQPYACVPHGGGRQHAEYSPQRTRLSTLGYHVGTIFAALPWEEFWDSGQRHRRLRELALESYLTEVADGWVLKQARHYRGRVQVEDEEAAGRALLIRMLSERSWLIDNFLLARETVRVVPHQGGEDLTRSIRRSAQDIAEANTEFERLRIEVHTSPTARTAAKIRGWAARRDGDTGNSAGVRQAMALADALDDLYGERGRSKRLREAQKLLERNDATKEIAPHLKSNESLTARDRVASIAKVLRLLRLKIESDIEADLRLRLFDLFDDLEAELQIAVRSALDSTDLHRFTLLKFCRDLVDASYGSGMLSKTEADYTIRQLLRVEDQESVSTAEYLETSRTLNRAVGWPVTTVRYVFAEPLTRYAALDERAFGFVDDMLRGSPVLALAQATRFLAFDAQLAAGVHRSVAGRPAPALMALNPGLARGRLRVLREAELAAGVQPARSEIVVLPQTVAELAPVAGILTGGEGNLLSHLQLLARNLGIPNVSVSAAMFANVEALNGKEVVLAVDSAGSIVLEPVENLSAMSLAMISENQSVIEPGSLEVPEPNLEWRDPIPLAKLRRKLSGRTVGPKAANLGELHRLFPGKVAPALALPFGLFSAHMETGSPSLREQLVASYQAHREGRLPEDRLHVELTRLREAISHLQLDTQSRQQILEYMAREFGNDPDYGIFIRSDTNVEDLPGFSGAGLSETLPHVVGRDQQLANISKVWASVLSPRSIAWRANLMKNPERIYASVLLMKSVPADKSGVLATTDLVTYEEGVTVSTGWGIGGAVAGEAAETLVLLPDGKERLISEAKTPFRRGLAKDGGFSWQPAAPGSVLTADEKRQLRELISQVMHKYEPVEDTEGRVMPWDIEFGFVDGQLTLFQIRPLVEKGYRRAARVTRHLSGDKRAPLARYVALDELTARPGPEKQ